MLKINLTNLRTFVITFSVMNALPKLLKLSLLPLLAVSLQAASSYKVQSGDTLSSIARKNGTTASKLMKENGISNPNLLKIGQVLKVPGSAPASSSSKPKRTSKPASGGSGNYTVKAGETLYAIARKHGLSVSQLSSLNPGLDPSRLSVGQKIRTTGAVASKPKAKTPPRTTPSPKPAVKKPAPAKPVPVIAKAKPAPTPAPAPATLPEIKPIPISVPELTPEPKPNLVAEKKVEIPASISSVMVSKEIAFGKLASQHRTSTKQLNELNGWSLKPTTILAKGSEIYVPGS